MIVNGRQYRRPAKPVVVVCLDGTGPEYLEAARGRMPNLERIRAHGAAGVARSVIPSFTNPNNVSLVTGVPPSVHGISGNYYYDRERDREVMMDDPAFLRCPTVLSAFAEEGASVAAVTAKDKLRRLLAKGLEGVCFSVERAHEATEAENGVAGLAEKVGRPNPGVYDVECSVWCVEAGDWLLRERRPDLLYLSTTDYVQHRHAPDTPEAGAFYARIDHFLGRLDARDVILGVTADHGMNAKTRDDGSPRVRYLESILTGAGVDEARVILPITDPYVVHHGALGSFATIYVANGRRDEAAALLRRVQGVELVLTRDEAAERFELPRDRLGELVALSNRHTVLGRTPEWHDLSAVREGLRSHGGLHEQVVPFIVNRPLNDEYAARLESGATRNYDMLDFLCNGANA